MATETVSNPETDPRLLTAYAAGDVIVQAMKTAEAEVIALKAQVAQLQQQLADALAAGAADQQAAITTAVATAVADLKAKIAAIP